MIRPDYRDFRTRSKSFRHSSEGSSWKKHKYIKRVDGTYYYPDSYEGGRHLPDGEKEKSMEDDTKIFDEFESFSKELMKKGEAYWDPEEVSKMTKEELGELYENMTGVKLGDKDLDRLFNSREARNKKSEDSTKNDLSEKDVENLAKEVIRGNFGNGQERKDLLGENYEEIQKRVNELMKGSAGSKTIPSDKTKAIGIAEEAAKKAVSLVDAYRNKTK